MITRLGRVYETSWKKRSKQYHQIIRLKRRILTYYSYLNGYVLKSAAFFSPFATLTLASDLSRAHEELDPLKPCKCLITDLSTQCSQTEQATPSSTNTLAGSDVDQENLLEGPWHYLPRISLGNMASHKVEFGFCFHCYFIEIHTHTLTRINNNDNNNNKLKHNMIMHSYAKVFMCDCACFSVCLRRLAILQCRVQSVSAFSVG